MSSENSANCALFLDCSSEDSSNSITIIGSNMKCQGVFEDDDSIASNDANLPKPDKKFNFQHIPNPPRVDVQEKIIICVDNSRDNSSGYSCLDSDSINKEVKPYSIRNEAVKIFITNKGHIAKNTQFAIASMESGNVQSLSAFSSDIQYLMKCVSEIKSVSEEESSYFDVTPIFNMILNAVDIPEQKNKKIMPPSYVIRIIFIYSNAYVKPIVNVKDASYIKFMMSPYCILDVLYLHEKQSDLNSVEQIFNELEKIVSPRSYLLESSRNVTKVFSNMAKLLAHPYQRVNQHEWYF